MENEILDFQKENSLQLNEQAKDYLMTACKWAKFLAIVGFVYVGFLVITGLISGATLVSSFGGIDPIFFFLLFILFGGLILYPSLKLYRFAIKGQEAIIANESDLIEESLSNLKSLFKFQGIVVIVFITLYVLAFITLLIFGASNFF